MPALDHVGSIYRIDHVGQAGGQQVVNVFHVIRERQNAPPFSNAESLNLINATVVKMNAFWAYLGVNLQRQFVKVSSLENLTPGVGPPNDLSAATVEQIANSDTGQIAGDTLPSYAAVSVAINTGAPGRNFRGGMRFSGVPEASTLQNQLDATVRANMQAAVDTWFPIWQSTVGEIVLRLCVFSRTKFINGPQGSQPGDSTNHYRIATSAFVWRTLGSQVSRKERHVTGS